jgi:hypothetical protein
MFPTWWTEFKIHSKRWLNWEFWPFYVFYIPIYFYWLYLSAQARSLAFFTAANPLMEAGGFVDYSKATVLQHIPEKWLPITGYLTQSNLSVASVLGWMNEKQLTFPIIIKPDKGERGFAVEKIEKFGELEAYVVRNQLVDEQFIVQEYCDEPLELGVMYSRMPGESCGRVTSVVKKELMELRGNGRHSLEELILQNKRASYYFPYFKQLLGKQLQQVPEANSIVPLVKIGNHCRGATFLNANHLINQCLHEIFDTVSQQIPGYFFGRYDLKVRSLDDLYAGNFKIIELNGANSEPAHIYDPKMKLQQAYRDLFAHWRRLFEVSVANHNQGVAYLSFSELYRKIRYHQKMQRQKIDL